MARFEFLAAQSGDALWSEVDRNRPEEKATYADIAEMGTSSGPREKLVAALKAKNITIQELGKRIGYDPGSLLYVIEGRGRLKQSHAEKIAKILPELTVEELLGGGDSPMIISETGVEGTLGAKPNIKLPPGMKGWYVPLLSLAQAGGYDAAHSDDFYEYGGVLALNVDDRRAFAVQVQGNSMESRLMDGDAVICSPSKKPVQGQMAVVKTKSGNSYIKYWKQEGEMVILESENEDYGPIRVPLAEIARAMPVVQTISSGMIMKG